MSDDEPSPEDAASQFWFRKPLTFLRIHEIRRMSEFVSKAAGSALEFESTVELIRNPKEELVAMALRAQRTGQSDDVIGTLLTLAACQGSRFALAALSQILRRRIDSAGRIGASLVERVELMRVAREIDQRLRTNPILDEFDTLRREVAGIDNAVACAETWAQFRKSKSSAFTHKVLAPKLKSLKHIEDGEQFKILAQPIPFWRTPVPPSVLSGVLAEEFPHLSPISDEIAEFVAGESAASLRPILLIGPPGIGKDSVIRRAAELVGRPLGELDLAGTSDNRILRGTSRGWSTAYPAFASALCAQHRCPNPIVQLSELDRAGGTRRNGKVHETLLSLTEPTTRRKWYDEGLGSEIDLGDVAFAFTSNSVDDTPPPLLSRLRVFRLERPRPEQVEAILRQAQRRFASEIGVPIDALPEPMPAVIDRLKAAAREGRFHLRLADRVARALGAATDKMPRH